MQRSKIICLVFLSVFTVIYSPNSWACEPSFGRGNLERYQWDKLQKEYLNTSLSVNNNKVLDVGDVSSILGFYGVQTKTTNHRTTEYWVWRDLKVCNRRIEAIFQDDNLIYLKGYGF